MKGSTFNVYLLYNSHVTIIDFLVNRKNAVTSCLMLAGQPTQEHTHIIVYRCAIELVTIYTNCFLLLTNPPPTHTNMLIFETIDLCFTSTRVFSIILENADRYEGKVQHLPFSWYEV